MIIGLKLYIRNVVARIRWDWDRLRIKQGIKISRWLIWFKCFLVIVMVLGTLAEYCFNYNWKTSIDWYCNLCFFEEFLAICISVSSPSHPETNKHKRRNNRKVHLHICVLHTNPHSCQRAPRAPLLKYCYLWALALA